MMSYIPYHLENQLRNRLIVEWVHLLLRTRLSDGVILFSSSWLAKCLIALSTIVAATIPSSNRFSAKDKVVGLMVFSTRILYISWCCVITLSSPFFCGYIIRMEVDFFILVRSRGRHYIGQCFLLRVDGRSTLSHQERLGPGTWKSTNSKSHHQTKVNSYTRKKRHPSIHS
jgi:hypothetical protein